MIYISNITWLNLELLSTLTETTGYFTVQGREFRETDHAIMQRSSESLLLFHIHQLTVHVEKYTGYRSFCMLNYFYITIVIYFD